MVFAIEYIDHIFFDVVYLFKYWFYQLNMCVKWLLIFPQSEASPFDFM
jgi:hypothetical protein